MKMVYIFWDDIRINDVVISCTYLGDKRYKTDITLEIKLNYFDDEEYFDVIIPYIIYQSKKDGGLKELKHNAEKSKIIINSINKLTDHFQEDHREKALIEIEDSYADIQNFGFIVLGYPYKNSTVKVSYTSCISAYSNLFIPLRTIDIPSLYGGSEEVQVKISMTNMGDCEFKFGEEWEDKDSKKVYKINGYSGWEKETKGRSTTIKNVLIKNKTHNMRLKMDTTFSSSSDDEYEF